MESDKYQESQRFALLFGGSMLVAAIAFASLATLWIGLSWFLVFCGVCALGSLGVVSIVVRGYYETTSAWPVEREQWVMDADNARKLGQLSIKVGNNSNVALGASNIHTSTDRRQLRYQTVYCTNFPSAGIATNPQLLEEGEQIVTLTKDRNTQFWQLAEQRGGHSQDKLIGQYLADGTKVTRGLYEAAMSAAVVEGRVVRRSKGVSGQLAP